MLVPHISAAAVATSPGTAAMAMILLSGPGAGLARRTPINKRAAARHFCLWRRRQPRWHVLAVHHRHWRHDGRAGYKMDDSFGHREARDNSQDGAGWGRVVDVRKTPAAATREDTTGDGDGAHRGSGGPKAENARERQPGRFVSADEVWQFRVREWRRRLREDPYEALFGAQNAMLAGKGWGRWAEAWAEKWEAHLDGLTSGLEKRLNESFRDDKGAASEAQASAMKNAAIETATAGSMVKMKEEKDLSKEFVRERNSESRPAEPLDKSELMYDPVSGRMVPKEADNLPRNAGRSQAVDIPVKKYKEQVQDIRSLPSDLKDFEKPASSETQSEGAADAVQTKENIPRNPPRTASSIELGRQWLLREGFGVAGRKHGQDEPATRDVGGQNRLTPEKGETPTFLPKSIDQSSSSSSNVKKLQEEDIDLLRSSDVRAGMGRVRGEPRKETKSEDEQRQRLEQDFLNNQEKDKIKKEFEKPIMHTYHSRSTPSAPVSSQPDESDVHGEAKKPVTVEDHSEGSKEVLGHTSKPICAIAQPPVTEIERIETAVERMSHNSADQLRAQRLQRLRKRVVLLGVEKNNPKRAASVELLQMLSARGPAPHSRAVPDRPAPAEQREPTKAERLLIDEISVQKHAMESATSQRSMLSPLKPPSDAALAAGGLEGGYDAGESDAETLLAAAKTSLFRVEKTLADVDIEVRKLNDRKLVGEIKAIYEDEYGPIAVGHEQRGSGASSASIVEGTISTAGIADTIPRTQSDSFRSMREVERNYPKGDRGDAVPKDMGGSESFVGSAARLGQHDRRESGAARQQHHHQVTGATEHQIPQSTDHQIYPTAATSPPIASSPSSSFLQQQHSELEYNYKFLAYDPSTRSVTTSTSSSAPGPDETSMPVSRALSRLSQPAKFLPHLASLLETHEAVAAAGNLLVLREARSHQHREHHHHASSLSSSSAPSPARQQTISDDSLSSSPQRPPPGRRARTINPIDGTTAPMPLPLAPIGNFASPTGFVSYAEPAAASSVFRPPPLRSPVSSAATEAGKGEEEGGKRVGRTEGEGGKGRGVMKTAIWAAAACYVAGVVAELIK